MANINFEPIVNAGFLYINYMLISNNATTPNTILNVTAGQARDSTNVFDINLGEFLGMPNYGVDGYPSQIFMANVITNINSAASGVNGLDTGTIAASTLYYVFVIGDPTMFNPAACLLSLSPTAPIMPYGYGIWRLIGSVVTDGSAHFLPFYSAVTGSSSRYVQYDAPISITVTASGTSATYSAMDLSPAVPNAGFGLVTVNYAWTPNAAGDTLDFTPTTATGNFIVIKGLVAGVQQTGSFQILPLSISPGKPEISYKVSAGTLNTVTVSGFNYLV